MSKRTFGLVGATVVALVVGAAGIAIAQPGPGWGGQGGPGGWNSERPYGGPGWGGGPQGRGGPHWGYGPGYQQQAAPSDASRSKLDDSVKAVVATAKKGEAWTTPRGFKRTPLLVDGKLVGNLWEDADLAALKAGSSWNGRFGRAVQLVDGTRVVGMVWLRD
ncbi:hypothetical protein [Rhodoplanes azumiensis]|uniref:DUF5666 domain-containing protein n=1 Tax=Rhodoplanes azumiensis TaxID=1897628 RepID=A0ABW5AHU8_9BRAD